jgi:hypothetical protein
VTKNKFEKNLIRNLPAGERHCYGIPPCLLANSQSFDLDLLDTVSVRRNRQFPALPAGVRRAATDAVLYLRRNRFRHGLRPPCCPIDHAEEQKLEDGTMPQMKEATGRKHRIKAMPALGAVGLSLSLASGTSAAISGTNAPTSATAARQVMDEEQISDVSLATFHLFDNESVDPERSGTRRTMVSQGACGADLYLPQNPPAVSGPVYQLPSPPRARPIRPPYKYRRS